MKRSLLLASAVLVIGCASSPATPPAAAPPSPAPVPATALEDHAGDSTETAIEVPADSADGGVKFENEWIFDRYGRFRRRGGGTGVLNGHRYNIVKIELANGDQKTVYFDITENWKRWTPK